MHPSARTLTMLSSLALVSSSVSDAALDAALAAERAAARGHAEPGQPVPGCLGCESATMASTSGATMCEPHREAFAALDAAREFLRAQPLPAVLQKPDAPRGPNRAQRRRAMFARRNGRA